MASLLPPVGMEVFRCFTAVSKEVVQQRHEAEVKERKAWKHQKASEKNLTKPARHLETGKSLPFIYGAPPPQLLCTPLEDLDPFYQSQKTFMVLSKGNIINRFSADSSCYLLSPFNPLRTLAIKTLLHPFFSIFILLAILGFGVLEFKFPVVKYVYMAIFVFEALVKVVARGFCVGRFTFLRDPWNWLDIIIISTLCFNHCFMMMMMMKVVMMTLCLRLVSQFVDLGKFAVLMTISLLLKIFTCSRGLKKTVEALVQSVKRLGCVIILTLFCLSILAMIGLQLFMGTLKNKCVIWSMNTNTTEFDFHNHTTSPENYYYIPGHPDPLVCGNQSDAEWCPDGFTCVKAGSNPNFGYTSYDSFFWSLMSLFRLMMHDFWEGLMQLTLRAAGKSYLIVFLFVFFPGCFFLLSLILAVVVVTRAEQEETQDAEAIQREEEFGRIVEVLKRREEEEASSRAETPEQQDSLQKKKSAGIRATKQEYVEEAEEHHRPLCCTCTDAFLKGDCCGCWRWLKQQHTFITNPFFDLVIIICIIVSTIFTAMEHYPMMEEFMETLVFAELVFRVIFAVEMIIKLVALGLHGYFQVRWHIFDFILVIISLVQLGLADVEGLSLLHSFLPFRVFRLARWWPMLHMFLKIVWASVGNLTLVLFITVFMFSVAGVQLFQSDYKANVCRISHDRQLPRWHMEDFFHTFMLVFRVLCGLCLESLWDCMEVSNDGMCVTFFMIVLIVGKLLILHLFLNLLFINVQLVDSEDKTTNILQSTMKQTRTWIPKRIWTLWGKNYADQDHKGDTEKDNKEEYLALSSVSSDQLTLDDNHTNMAAWEAPVAVAEIEFRTPENAEEKETQHCDVMQKRKDETHPEPEDCCCNSCYICCPFLEIDTSQGTGRVWSNFRRACLCIMQHKFFEGFIVFIILLSCAALVFEDIYLGHRPVLQRVLKMADLVFTFVFLVEMLLKWIAFGFKKYFTSFWCWLDFLILDVSLFSLMGNMLGYTSRPLRALRTLRVPSRFKGMRVVLKVLAVTLPSMFSMLLVILVIWLVFSVIGVNLFAGKFSYCYNETSEELFSFYVVNNMTECFSLMDQNFSEVNWKTWTFNFDNVGMGFLSLLIMGTSSGWMDIMYAAVDSRQVEDQPHYEINVYMYLYFICFIIIGCFFTLNLFIRVIIDTIHQQRHKFGGKHVFVTDQQQKYLSTIKKRFSEKRNKTVPQPQNCCLAWLFDLVTALYFEIFMVVVIFFNMVVLMVETDDQSEEKSLVLNWIHLILVAIFLVEFILKIIALRKHYFRNVLHIVDFVVLTLSIIGLFLADILEKYFGSPSLFSVMRLGRLFTLCGAFPHIRFARRIWMLIMGFVMSLPALFNIGLLFFLIVYTFSIIGMFNFAYVKHEMMIDDMFNFKTFGNSIISMTMITTSSGWDGLLSPIMNTPPDCDLRLPEPGNCANPTVGIVFFSSYILLFCLLVIHLFIVVILELFNTASPEDAEMLSDDHLQMFYETWRRFDPSGSQVIQYSELADFCDGLQDPLRIPKPNTIKLTHLNLPLFPGDQISCLDVLRTITTQVRSPGTGCQHFDMFLKLCLLKLKPL
uniref:sodium channel protein type 4 subunit alpha B n=1 Tax=Maylandia zebra TaxID=106582 RepID=UPI000D31C7B6|nr:sodium channel protein type 4 subunit alpha B [Maylandia zebra]